MDVIDLDGNKTRIRLNHCAGASKRSSYHLRARKVLSKEFAQFITLEEVPLPIRRGDILYADFFIPLLRLAVEVQGEQHFKFSLRFHQDKNGFRKAQKRDREKLEFCELNNIRLVEFRYDESDEQWTDRLKSI